MAQPDMRPVRSTHLARAGYDSEARELWVEFQDGDTYRYSDVPQEVADGLMQARSQGAYFWNRIRDVYPYEQV